MKISKQTWHARLFYWSIDTNLRMDITSGSRPVTLCRYFREIVFDIFLLIGMAFIPCALLFLVGSFIYHFPYFFLLFVASAVMCWAVYYTAFSYYRNQTKKPRRQSFIGAMLKAMKNKICPIIEWDD